MPSKKFKNFLEEIQIQEILKLDREDNKTYDEVRKEVEKQNKKNKNIL